LSGLLGRWVRSLLGGIAARSCRGRSPRIGLPLPPKSLRQGGRHFRSDVDFLSGAERDAKRLVHYAGLGPATRLVDFGCGSGRLLIGIRDLGLVIRSYVGLEVQNRHVQWANRFLRDGVTNVAFVKVDSANNLYNPAGNGLQRWPLHDGSADLVYAYSVFSHMRGDEVRFHLEEAARVADTLVLTAFVESGCPPETENPSGYRLQWKGPVHCVRYEKDHLLGLARDAGLVLQHFEYESDTDGQSLLVFGKARPALVP
jgi:SAM-dependent methyltransferase